MNQLKENTIQQSLNRFMHCTTDRLHLLCKYETNGNSAVVWP